MESANQGAATGHLKWHTLLAPLILCAGLSFLYYHFWYLAYRAFDVTMYVVAGKKILAGAKMYVDVVDLNPPLILYIHTGFDWIARAFHLPELEFFSFSVLAMIAAATALLGLYIKRNTRYSAYAALMLPIASLHMLVVTEFGQREHLFMLFFLPYLCLRWQEEKDRHAGYFLVSLFTGLLACLKPFFIGTLVAYELYLFFYRRPASKLHYAILLLPGFLYGLSFFLWSRESNQAYWLELVPLELKRYSAMGITWATMLSVWWRPIFVYGLLSFSYMALGKKEKGKSAEILLPLGICGLSGLLGALLQGKGWEYHLAPALFPAFFGFPIFLSALRARIPSGVKFAFVSAVCASLLCWHSLVAGPEAISATESPEVSFVTNQIKHFAAPRDQVVVFSPSSRYSFPLFNQENYTPGTRYQTMFPLPLFNRNPERMKMLTSHYPRWEELPGDERVFVEHMKEDLQRYKPELLVFPIKSSPTGEWTFLPVYFDPYLYAVSTGIFSGEDPNYRLVFKTQWLRIFQRR